MARIKQKDITDCGAACIASVAWHYKLKLPIARIRQLASTDQKGTNVLGLLDALATLGFEARGVRGTGESLASIPLPAIAHVVVNGKLHHYVVIQKVTARFVTIMDPSDGRYHRLRHQVFMQQWSGVLIILAPGENFKTGNQRQSTPARLWSLLLPHRRLLTEVLVGALAYTVIGLSTSIFLQKIVDYVIADANHQLLNLMSLSMLVLLIGQTFINVMKNMMTMHSGQAIDAALIMGYYRHLLYLPQRFFDTMRVGEIISRINDAVKIRTFINEALTAIVVNVMIVLLSFALMFTYYWKLAIVMLISIPLYAFVFYISNFLNKKMERKLMESSAALEAQWVESLQSMRTIKSLGLEQHALNKMENRFVDLLGKVYRSGQNTIFSTTAAECLSRLFTILLLWAGAGFVLDNQLTPGELLSFYALIGYFTGPVNSLVGANKFVQSALIAADRLFEILDLESEQEGPVITLAREDIGDIQFHGVNFRYGSRGAVLNNLQLTIPKGKVTAITGESGSGKSTLIGILQKLYPVDSGQVMIGHYDLKNISRTSLCQCIGVVPQHTDLFAGTITDNIAPGITSPDIRKVIDLCARLGLKEMLDGLPLGLNTHLSENGMNLSGGQRQRIAIARALYRDPQILILDEATSSLDNFSEQRVQEVLIQLSATGKTIILITHRTAPLAWADEVITLTHGTNTSSLVSTVSNSLDSIHSIS